MITLTIDNDFLISIGQILEIGKVETITILGRGRNITLFGQIADVFKISCFTNQNNEDFCLRLPAETVCTLFRKGEISISVNATDISIYLQEEEGIVKCRGKVAKEFEAQDDFIVQVMQYVANNSLDEISQLDWLCSISAIAKFRDKKINPIKGLAINKGYAYIISNALQIYRQIDYMGSMMLSNTGLAQLVKYTSNVQKCEVGRVDAYNICVIGNTILGWRRTRVEVELAISDIRSIKHIVEGRLRLRELVDTMATLPTSSEVIFNFGKKEVSFKTNRGIYDITMFGEFSLPREVCGSEDLDEFTEVMGPEMEKKKLSEIGEVRMDYGVLQQILANSGKGVCQLAVTETFLEFDLSNNVTVIMARL